MKTITAIMFAFLFALGPSGLWAQEQAPAYDPTWGQGQSPTPDDPGKEVEVPAQATRQDVESLRLDLAAVEIAIDRLTEQVGVLQKQNLDERVKDLANFVDGPGGLNQSLRVLEDQQRKDRDYVIENLVPVLRRTLERLEKLEEAQKTAAEKVAVAPKKEPVKARSGARIGGGRLQ